MAPTLVASRTALPPEGVHFALGRPGGETLAPMLVALRTALPPEGALHLRPGRAGSAALADDEGVPTLFTAFTLLPHQEVGLKRVSPALCAHG